MDRKNILTLFFSIALTTVLAASLFLVACAPSAPASTPAPAPATKPAASPSPAAQPQTTKFQLTAQSPFGKTSRIVYAFFDPFLSMVEKKSEGRISFKRFYNAELVPGSEQLEAGGKGTLDVFYSPGTYYASLVPAGDYDLMFYNYPSQASAGLFLDLPEVEEIARKDYAKYNVYHLGAYAHDWQNFLTNFPVTKVSDLKGKKMRGGGGLSNAGLEAMGATAVYIAVPEIYTAMQRGTVEGMTMPEYYMWNSKYYEIAKYVNLPANIPSQVERFWFSTATWNKLGPDLQQIIQDSFNQMKFWYVVESTHENEQIRALVQSKGIIYTELSGEELAKAKAAVEPLKVAWSKKDASTARLYQLLQDWDKKKLESWTLK